MIPRRSLIQLALTFAVALQAADIDSRLKLEFDELSAKAAGLIDTVNNMEDRARADGHSLHADLLTQRALVQSGISDAQESLEANDAPALQVRLKRLRARIERLASML